MMPLPPAFFFYMKNLQWKNAFAINAKTYFFSLTFKAYVINNMGNMVEFPYF